MSAPAPSTCPCPGECNVFGISQLDCQTEAFGGVAPLPQAYGYAIVLGFGLLLSLITSILIFVDRRFGGTKVSAEQYTTAGRTVKTGLIADVVCSQWTWAATLLQSSNVAWKYGVSGPFWYAAGATIQVLLFGILAVELKRKSPCAHTMLEVVRARWGTSAHIVFFVFAILTNITVTAMLLLGGAAVMQSLTGMNLYAAAFLIPVGVIIYTAIGGLKGTFLSFYGHAVVVFIALCIFTLEVYAGSSYLGSPSKVWNNLNVMADPNVVGSRPVDGNKAGSYITMLSTNGFIFGIINIIGNFGTVFMDQSYWLGAIASKPTAAYKGYILGGLMWFCIPFALATSLGLAAVALDLPISVADANAGLVPPAVAQFLLGDFGAVLMTIMLFMAVTGTGSAEMVAVASLVAYDLYRTYINKNATGRQILHVSRAMIVIFGLLMGGLAIGLFAIGLSLGFVYLFMGILVSPAVLPVASCLTWKKATKAGAIMGSIFGMLLGISAWLITCQAYYGSINIDNLGGDYPMLAGNLTSILSSGIILIVVSLAKPDNYDFLSMKDIKVVDEAGMEMHKITEEESKKLDGALKIMHIVAWGLTFVLVILWPCLALPAGVFSEGYFTFWVILSITWGIIATLIGTFLPIWEARRTIASVCSNMVHCTKADTDVPADISRSVVSKGEDISVKPSGSDEEPSTHGAGDAKAQL